MQKKKTCYVANLGDTRAVLSLDGTAKRVSVDHKPTTQSEIDRIKYFQAKLEKKEELQLKEESQVSWQ